MVWGKQPPRRRSEKLRRVLEALCSSPEASAREIAACARCSEVYVRKIKALFRNSTDHVIL
jgi:hypothetical protein